jgi:hypothetical protein
MMPRLRVASVTSSSWSGQDPFEENHRHYDILAPPTDALDPLLHLAACETIPGKRFAEQPQFACPPLSLCGQKASARPLRQRAATFAAR